MSDDPSSYVPEPARDESTGRYARETLCHCCGKPVRDYCSDDDVLQLDQAGCLGLIICERVRCGKRVAGKTPTERLAVYVAQQSENEAAVKEGRKAKSVKL